MIAKITNTSASGIQSGAVTHHHDQYCTGPISANLSVKKIKNITVPRPIPFDVDLLSDMTS